MFGTFDGNSAFLRQNVLFRWPNETHADLAVTLPDCLTLAKQVAALRKRQNECRENFRRFLAVRNLKPQATARVRHIDEYTFADQ